MPRARPKAQLRPQLRLHGRRWKRDPPATPRRGEHRFCWLARGLHVSEQ